METICMKCQNLFSGEKKKKKKKHSQKTGFDISCILSDCFLEKNKKNIINLLSVEFA